MPPPLADADRPLNEWVNHVGLVSAGKPLAITVATTHTSGTSATRTASDTRTVAVRSTVRRRRLSF